MWRAADVAEQLAEFDLVQSNIGMTTKFDGSFSFDFKCDKYVGRWVDDGLVHNVRAGLRLARCYRLRGLSARAL